MEDAVRVNPPVHHDDKLYVIQSRGVGGKHFFTWRGADDLFDVLDLYHEYRARLYVNVDIQIITRDASGRWFIFHEGEGTMPLPVSRT